ncbi:chromatin-remodeling ATPase INO80 isoform X2 [Lepeophtheirus salmonis]|nr:chromatin-remodeling ATPase INO80-like isoform X2 [Lepeophtheirus salmonis]
MNKLSKLRPDPPPKKRRKKKGDGSDEGKKYKNQGYTPRPPTIEQLNTRRRRAWVSIMKKEISKAQKARNLSQKEKLVNSKRVATNCMRFVRQRAMQSQRVMKETVWRAKRLSREMQAYWRRFDRAEKLQKRQQEKVAEEQRKMDVELLEAKRQQRKLNFLITQTELYAHFMASKIGTSSYSSEGSILSRLDEEDKTDEMRRLGDDYDCEYEKTSAKDNAINALEVHASRSRVYDQDLDPCSVGLRMSSSEEMKEEREQPSIFEGMLKAYQLKGMNWLLNLYDQGINGILADEMGLGKTVQALSLLAYIAERYNIWGPFLVITPASTLHNWQQEVTKFLPSFKVVPYWGSPQERKVLRHFWDQKNLHTQSASFHIVITSYQLVISDFKYFNRIKWQYLVLDEAQAIKSSSSQRWKMLLEFKCRNRLLLSGTPIQNSMAELWSLLHFVMPTLFDSHQEFNDWFSKDIESTAENKSQIDEKQISRLHLILKPFMLRRIKKDVENELTDKLEVLLYCPLTIRQKLLYMGLKKKIHIEELLSGLGSQNHNSALTSSLMNLVMQFRKVCNHPELFERREARSPFIMPTNPYLVPKLLYHDYVSRRTNKLHILMNKLNIFHPNNVHASIKENTGGFSYTRFIGLSPKEQFYSYGSLLERWKIISALFEKKRRLKKSTFSNTLMLEDMNHDSFLSDSGLVFVNPAKTFISHSDIILRSMPETLSHRLVRSRRNIKIEDINEDADEDYIKNLLPEFPYVQRPKMVFPCQPVDMPAFLYDLCPSVGALKRTLYSYDRSCAWHLLRQAQWNNEIMFGNNDYAHRYENRNSCFSHIPVGGLTASRPTHGWSHIVIPNKQTLVSDAGKLFVLDSLLARLKEEGHRVLIYSQMTRMIDLLEEYMWHKKYTFMRLDGSSKIHERRDMVADFQERSDIFAFLLSTRAGGLGINLTAADTVIFYDSDWNPTVDQQAMDRAHRLGQTKQVTVYRLICKGTIEERILQRAREKSEIQRMVIQGGSFKGKNEQLKPNEVVCLLLDDEETERRYNARRGEESSIQEQQKTSKRKKEEIPETPTKKIKTDDEAPCIDDDNCSSSSEPLPLFDFLGEKLGPKKTKRGTGNKRGRPRVTPNIAGRGESVSMSQLIPTSPHSSIKRGPGRPRSKVQVGPSHQGSRGGSSKIKRPAALNPVDGII